MRHFYENFNRKKSEWPLWVFLIIVIAISWVSIYFDLQ